jgi:hypothetical protein
MKLVENGIDIPNKLLRAHEDGRVVFFCGAGVSKNTAEKPDFIQLAKAIIITRRTITNQSRVFSFHFGRLNYYNFSVQSNGGTSN